MVNHAGCAVPGVESVLTESDIIVEPDQSFSKQDVERFKRELQSIPEPNCGRIEELKEKIKNKTYLTREMIEDAATRLAARFMGKE